MSAAEKHPDRTTYLGSHAFSAIIGKNPFVSAMDLYCQMKKLAPPFEQKEHMKWGLILEDPILNHYAERHGNVVMAKNLFKMHSQIGFIGGTADGLMPEGKIGVDAKNIGFDRDNKWGTPGTDEVPLYIKAQAHHFNMLFNADKWDIAVLQHGQKYDEYTVERDKEMDEVIIETLQDFWENNLKMDQPPEMDDSDGAKQFLMSKYPQHEEPIREATPEEIEMLDGYQGDLAKLKELEALVATTENTLKSGIGKAEGLFWGKSKVTWKTQNGRKGLDKDAMEADHPGLAAKYTKQGDPMRVFRKSFKA